MGQMTLITGVSRRRRWSEADRQRILAAIDVPGTVIADVARREDVCTSLIYKWRRQRRAAGAGVVGFAPALLVEDPTPVPPASSDAVVTVELPVARVKIGATAPASLVTAVLRALK